MRLPARVVANLVLLASFSVPLLAPVRGQDSPAIQAREDLVVLPETWDVQSARDLKDLTREVDAKRALAVKLEADQIVVDPAQTWSAFGFQGRTLPRSDFTALEARVTQKFISERESRPSFLKMLGDSVQRFDLQTIAFNPGNLVRNATEAGGNAEFATLATSQLTTLGRSRKVAGALYTAGVRGFDVRLDEVALLPGQYGANARAGFELQYDTTLASYLSAILNPTQESIGRFEADARLTHQEFVQMWPQLRRDPEARRSAVRRLRSLNQQSSLKALYGVESRFDPAGYDRIYRQSQRVVAVGRPNTPNCSGFLIDSRWVLTAGHCMENLAVSDIRMFIDIPADETFVGERNIRLKVSDRWPASTTGENAADLTDFALLRLDDAELSSRPALRQWLDTLDQRIPVCFSREEANYGDAVVVIGRLRDAPALVYDHAYVWFPFRVSEAQFLRLAADTGLGLELFVQEWFDQGDWTREFNDRYGQFENAYRPNGSNGRQFRMKRRRDMGERPYIGFDTDTVQGNSGSPIISRADNCVLGVFAGGLIDGSSFDNSSWSRHEFGTPISAVIAELASRGSAPDAVSEDVARSRQALLDVLTR